MPQPPTCAGRRPSARARARAPGCARAAGPAPGRRPAGPARGSYRRAPPGGRRRACNATSAGDVHRHTAPCTPRKPRPSPPPGAGLAARLRQTCPPFPVPGAALAPSPVTLGPLRAVVVPLVPPPLAVPILAPLPAPAAGPSSLGLPCGRPGATAAHGSRRGTRKRADQWRSMPGPCYSESVFRADQRN